MLIIILANIALTVLLCYAIFWALRNRRKRRLKKRIFWVVLSLILLFFAVNTSFLITFIINKSPTTYFYALHRYKTAPAFNIVNFHLVAPGIMRGGQSDKEGLLILKEYFDLKTILDLRDGKGIVEWEAKLAKELGIDFINIPMSGAKEQSVEKIEQILNIITDKSRQPIFVHCHAGKDRTGLIFAAYRIKYDHWSIEDAYKEMLGYGFDEAYYQMNKSLRKWYDYIRQEKVRPSGTQGF
jgi:protein tyrosine phosphatase (PTP) superfamily phosphohydrolase (DUF442 family)